MTSGNTPDITFNNDPRHFEPTDVVVMHLGQTIEEVFRQNEFAFLLAHKEILKVILFFNGLSQVQATVPAIDDFYLMLNHPKMYRPKYKNHVCYEPFRNRSFSFFESKIRSAGQVSLLRKIHELLSAGSKVLDIGCGTGRALMEIQQRFRLCESIGVSLPGESVDPLVVAEFFSFDISTLKLPRIIECNLNSAKLRSCLNEKFNFIYSFATFRYIEDKISMLDEVYILLEDRGIAVIQLTMLEIFDHENKLIPLESFFKHELIVYSKKEDLVFMMKDNSRTLNFSEKVAYSRERSTHRLAQQNSLQNHDVGWNSVYQMKKL